MKAKNEAGFSITELLLVIVCIGIIAGISVHYFIKARIAAENAAAVATLSLIRQNETVHLAQRQRFARLDELNAQHGSLGTVEADLTLTRAPFKFDLTTSTGTPTISDNKSLATEYLITATRTGDSTIPYVLTLDQSGVITKVLPVEGNLGD
jgi:type II secretory pathway pseudopilin PulG